MRRYTPTQLILSLLGVLIFFIVFNYTNRGGQDDSYGYRDNQYIGRVTKKFIDRDNHSYQMVIIQCEYKVKNLALNVETSGLYDFLEVNDSIVKNSGTLDFRIIRVNLDTTIVMKFD